MADPGENFVSHVESLGNPVESSGGAVESFAGPAERSGDPVESFGFQLRVSAVELSVW